MRLEWVLTYYAAGASFLLPFGPWTPHLSRHWWTFWMGGQPDVPPAGLSCPELWFPIIGNIMNCEFALNRALGSWSGDPFSQEAKVIANERAEFHLLRFVLGFFAKTSANSLTSFYWLWCDLVLEGSCPTASCWKKRYELSPKTVQHICDHDGSIAVGGHLTVFNTLNYRCCI